MKKNSNSETQIRKTASDYEIYIRGIFCSINYYKSNQLQSILT